MTNPVTGIELPLPAADESVERVLVMFKCHLDVGFTDTEAAVLRDYYERHIPAAVKVAQQLRREGADRYVWTVPAWLLYRFFEAASPDDRMRAEQAVAVGDLAWHALPFTWYTELLDRSSVEASLKFSARLDARFGVRTTAARLTDVPGHTRGLIGPLAAAGVRFLDIGVNPGCRAPAVPDLGPGVGLPQGEEELDPDLVRWHDAEPVHADQHTPEDERRRLCTEGANAERTHLFRWRDPAGQEITVLYHPRSYGSTVRLPQIPVAVSMRVHGDNLGPHSLESVRASFSSLRRKFPNAVVEASNLSRIGDAVAQVHDQLPVLEAEIGDSWIYGTGSDPAKTSRLRELLRLRQEWIDNDRLQPGGDTDLDFLSELIPAPEHNWGLSTSVYLRSWTNYSVADLATARATDPVYRTNDTEWAAKRERPLLATSRLPGTLRAEARRRLSELNRPAPVPTAPASPTGVVLENPVLRLKISTSHGGLVELIDLRTGRDWCGPDGLLVLNYQTYSVEDYRRFAAAYNHAAFTSNDFGKPGLADYPPTSLLWTADHAQIHPAAASDWTLVDLAAPTGATDQQLTAWPATIRLGYRLHPHLPQLQIGCWIADKPANRCPEALWLSFCPAAPDSSGWRLDKLGQPVDPHDVIDDGGRHLHGVGRGLTYRDGEGRIDLDTLDAHLVSPGGRGLLHFDNQPLDLRRGVQINLYNNLWGTAFPQWYDLNMRFRFTIRLPGAEQNLKASTKEGHQWPN